MKKKLYIFFLLLLVSCNNPRNNSLKEIEDRNLTLLEYDYCSKKNHLHEFDSVTFVPLETNERSLISSITKILYKNETYYIFDKVQAMIFLFDDNGSYITKIHNIGSGPGEYADISDFDIDADLNIYISSIVGRKIIKYKYPDYKLFTEYKTNATVMEIAVDEKTGKIWGTNIFQTEDGICLGFYSNEKFVPVIASRGIADNANTPFKAQSFYKSGNHLFFNPRYSPYIYMIDNDEVSKYMKIISDDFVDNSDLELEKDFKKERGVREQYSTNECLISGVNSFYQCKGHFLAEIWRNHGAPLLLEYEAKEKEGYLFCPLLDPQIYILNEYNSVRKRFPRLSPLRAYVKAWNTKVIPIFLTVTSTILGFVPFMAGMEKEGFWFPLAAGTIGGLIMSVIGVFIFLPVFTLKKKCLVKPKAML